jgi:hypothetical protein
MARRRDRDMGREAWRDDATGVSRETPAPDVAMFGKTRGHIGVTMDRFT